MKTLIIYHSADFDGTLSRDVCVYWLRRSKREHEITTFGWNYGDPVPVISNWDIVYLVDISIPELLVDENRDRIVWIDHHETAIDRHGGEWMGIRIDGVAACRLCYQWFVSGESASHCPTLDMFQRRYVNEPILVRLAGEYDIWDKRDPRADTLQFGLRGAPKFDALDHLEKWREDPTEAMRDIIELLDMGTVIQSYAGAENERAARSAHTLTWCGKSFLCFNGRGNSLTVQSAVRPEHDAILMWRWTGSKVLVSLYGVPHKPEVDLSDIARFYGGGGHRQACGFEVSLEWISKLLNGTAEDVEPKEVVTNN